MKDESLNRMIKKLISWRKEIGDPKVSLKIDGERLQESLEKLSKVGVTESYTVHVIMVCEWFFRLRKITGEDIEEFLEQAEVGFLNAQMEPEIIYHLLKALEPTIRKNLMQEGRRIIPFGIYFPGSYFSLLMGRSNGAKGRININKIAPTKPGPIAWMAPAISGSVIKQHLLEKGVSRMDLILELVAVLRGKEAIEERDFKRIDESLKGTINKKIKERNQIQEKAFEPFKSFYKYCAWQYETTLTPEGFLIDQVTREPQNWEDVLLEKYDGKKSLILGGGDAPPKILGDPEDIRGLVTLYSTSGTSKVKGKKNGK